MSLPSTSVPHSDRTGEFKAAVESQRLKLSKLPESKQKLLANGNSKTSKNQLRNEFTKQASQISKEIQSTTVKLEKLAQCE